MIEASKTNPNQSIKITGSQLSNSQIGQSLCSYQQNLSQSSKESSPSMDEIIQYFSEIEGLIRNSGLPQEIVHKVLAYLSASEEETKASSPDKNFAASSLKKAAETLSEADKIVNSSQNIFAKTLPAFERIFQWLGLATSFFP